MGSSRANVFRAKDLRGESVIGEQQTNIRWVRVLDGRQLVVDFLCARKGNERRKRRAVKMTKNRNKTKDDSRNDENAFDLIFDGFSFCRLPFFFAFLRVRG